MSSIELQDRLSDEDVDSIFEDWEDRKVALQAKDPTVKKRKKRKRKHSTDSSLSEDLLPVKKTLTLSRKSINNAIRLLRRDKLKPSTAESRMQKYCKGELSYTTSYDSPTCILVAIRWCILTRNWRSLVEVLLIFLKVNKNRMFTNYIRQVSYFN